MCANIIETTENNFVRSLLILNGVTQIEIATTTDTTPCLVSFAMNNGSPIGEAAVAKALGMKASDLWPSRYDRLTGTRLSSKNIEDAQIKVQAPKRLEK